MFVLKAAETFGVIALGGSPSEGLKFLEGGTHGPTFNPLGVQDRRARCRRVRRRLDGTTLSESRGNASKQQDQNNWRDCETSGHFLPPIMHL